MMDADWSFLYGIFNFLNQHDICALRKLKISFKNDRLSLSSSKLNTPVKLLSAIMTHQKLPI